jgi:hypothetical protein
MRIRGLSQQKHLEWAKRARRGEAPPFAPLIVRQYPILLEVYENAFRDGLYGRPPNAFSHPLYAKWYREGCEMRQLLDKMGLPTD